MDCDEAGFLTSTFMPYFPKKYSFSKLIGFWKSKSYVYSWLYENVRQFGNGLKESIF